MKQKMNLKTAVNLAITLLFVLLIGGFGVAFWVVPDRDFSAEENRILQSFPTISADGWLDGSVSSALTSYYSDQFPLRRAFLDTHAVGELASGRGESNGVLIGKDGQLAVRRFDMYVDRLHRAEDTDRYLPAHVDAGLASLVRLDDTLDAAGIPLTVLLAPRTIDVTAADFAYPSTLSDELDATIQSTLADGGVDSVEMQAYFRAAHEAGEYVYYRTDHHWTTKGAYAAYVAVMESMGMADETLPATAFTVQTVENFYGTTHSRAGLSTIPPDTLEIWRAADGSDRNFTVTDENGNVVIESGFINETYLSEKDKYAAFLDGTHRCLFITEQETVPSTAQSTAQSTVPSAVTDTQAVQSTAKPRLLLARDSFANSMVPFLARHFDIVMVNLSGGMTNLSELSAQYDCDRVLVVCNRENLVTSDCFVAIR